MSETERLKLPKIDGNMTADVVRDHNSLAEAIDSKAGEVNGLATLGEDGKVPDDQISVDTSDLATKQEVTTGLNGKVDKEEGKGLSTNDFTTQEKNKLSGIAQNANNYTHPSSHPASMITESETRRFVSDTEKTAWNGKASEQSVTDLGQALSEHQTEKATLTTEGHVQLSNATNSTSNALAATPSAVKSAMDRANEAFTSASNGKTLVGNAITGVDENVVIPADPTFNDLAGAIGQISTGKKWASGVLMSSNTTKSFPAHGGGNVNHRYISFDFSALGFIPSLIFIHSQDKTLIGPSTWTYDNYMESGSQYANYFIPNANLRIPYTNGIVDIPASAANKEFYWIAFE